MRRFYFNVRRGAVVFEDHEGEMLSGSPEAWAWAVADGQKLIADGVLTEPAENYWIEIVDDRRRPVATVPLDRLA